MPSTWIRPLDSLSIDDIGLVGGKNAALGEMIAQLSTLGVAVPGGFATTSQAYRDYLVHNDLETVITREMTGLDLDDVADLQDRAQRVRDAIRAGSWPPALATAIQDAYRAMGAQAGGQVSVAVRSSATAEDLPNASFAGQQETFLHVRGADDVLEAVRNCYASLFLARAVAYRANRGFGHLEVGLSAGVQRMVRTDVGASGVLFTLEPDSGHRDFVYVTGAWGLGENVVQGRVVPDAFFVHKPTLAQGFPSVVWRRMGSKATALRYDVAAHTLADLPVSEADQNRWTVDDAEVLQLARWAVTIEQHFSAHHGRPTPMDIEWGKDGETGELFILQARPETVHSQDKPGHLRQYHLQGTPGTPLVTGLAVGSSVGTGIARVCETDADLAAVQPGDVLIASTTNPDWEPVMKIAAAIVTEQGGRTSHAAIVSREHGIAAVVGAEGAKAAVQPGQVVTVSCAEGGEGRVYAGEVPFTVEEIDLTALGTPKTDIMVNVGDPEQAFSVSRLPVAGIGLARMEFIYAGWVGIHPLAMLHPDQVPAEVTAEIGRRLGDDTNPRTAFVRRLSEGIAVLAAAFHPRPVILRFSDFKSNEYAHLVGGTTFEPDEENPMIGWRGASRYHHPVFKEAFALEVEAVRRVREHLGLTNVHVMVPFCRTPEEGQLVLDEMAAGGLARGKDGLLVYVMAEIPSNVLLAEEFAALFDGFSIGSNDLTQLVYGVDRDSAMVSHLFDDDGPALRKAVAMLLEAAVKTHTHVGICGQSPSDHPEFGAWLVEHGIDSISLTPDAVLRTTKAVLAAEAKLGR